MYSQLFWQASFSMSKIRPIFESMSQFASVAQVEKLKNIKESKSLIICDTKD
jgi:hypothetical protein